LDSPEFQEFNEFELVQPILIVKSSILLDALLLEIVSHAISVIFPPLKPADCNSLALYRYCCLTFLK
jgi:hypothetical protein